MDKYIKLFARVSIGALGLCALSAFAQHMIIGVDNKVYWDADGKPVFSPPGKDAVVVVDIADRLNPRIVGTLPLMNLGTFIVLAVERWQLPWPHLAGSMPLSSRMLFVFAPVIIDQPVPRSALAASPRNISSINARPCSDILPPVWVTSSGSTTSRCSAACAEDARNTKQIRNQPAADRASEVRKMILLRGARIVA